MPYLAHKPCAKAGCAAYAVPGAQYCSRHLEEAKKQKLKDRWAVCKNTAKLYNSAIYQRMRAAQLRQKPLCTACLARGKIKAATDCDHIVPHKGDLKLFFDQNNLQSLCHACHASKTAREDGGFGHKVRKN